MSKTSQGQYFTLPCAKRPLWESRDRFKLYVFMPFPRFIKVEPK